MTPTNQTDASRWQRGPHVLGYTGGWDTAPVAHKALFDQAVSGFQGNPFTELFFFPWSNPAIVANNDVLEAAPPRRTLLRATVCSGLPSDATLALFSRLRITDAFLLNAEKDLPPERNGVRLHALDPSRPLDAIGDILAGRLELNAPPHTPTTPLPGAQGEGLYIFTAAAFNYLPRARLLTESLRHHLPRAHLCLALADVKPKDFDLASCGFDSVLAVEDLADSIPDLPRWTFCHDVMERSTAIKPFVLERLLAKPDCRAVFFFATAS